MFSKDKVGYTENELYRMMGLRKTVKGTNRNHSYKQAPVLSTVVYADDLGLALPCAMSALHLPLPKTTLTHQRHQG